jgi:flagellar protein FlaG
MSKGEVMNEISTNTLAIRHAAGKPTESQSEPSGRSGLKSEQAQQAVVAKQAEVVDKNTEQLAGQERLDRVVSQMNDFIQSEQRDLRFQIDEQSGETVISVLERESGELIRQIPNEDFLKLARQVKDNEPINLIATSS